MFSLDCNRCIYMMVLCFWQALLKFVIPLENKNNKHNELSSEINHFFAYRVLICKNNFTGRFSALSICTRALLSTLLMTLPPAPFTIFCWLSCSTSMSWSILKIPFGSSVHPTFSWVSTYGKLPYSLWKNSALIMSSTRLISGISEVWFAGKIQSWLFVNDCSLFYGKKRQWQCLLHNHPLNALTPSCCKSSSLKHEIYIVDWKCGYLVCSSFATSLKASSSVMRST